MKAPIVGFSLMGVLTAGRRPSRVSCAFDRLPRLVNRLKSPRMLLAQTATSQPLAAWGSPTRPTSWIEEQNDLRKTVCPRSVSPHSGGDLSDSRLNGAQEAARRRDEAQGATLLSERDRKRKLAEDREVRANAVAHPPAGA